MPSKFASTQPGLRERIKSAESAEEIAALLKEGEGYQYASNETRRRWIKAAKERREELSE